MLKNTVPMLMLALLAGCEASTDNNPAYQAGAGQTPVADGCTTTGSDSPIVAERDSTVTINGKAVGPGQTADCAPAAPTALTTHGANSPIVTGAGSTLIITTDR